MMLLLHLSLDWFVLIGITSLLGINFSKNEKKYIAHAPNNRGSMPPLVVDGYTVIEL